MAHSWRSGFVPRLSVLLSYYNLEHYLPAAIESILGQSFSAYELLLLDDGSTDRSSAIAKHYAELDPRIRVLRSDHNRGISATLNEGIAEAREEWIALMDGDDISLPLRLERQIEYLHRYPNLVAVGCFPLMVDESGGPICTLDIYREFHNEIQQRLLDGHGWAFLQPTAIMRREVVRQIGGFREDLPTSMDLDFFLRLCEVGQIANVPEVLYHYRMRPKSVTHARTAANWERHVSVLQDAYRRRGLNKPLPTEGGDGIQPEPADCHLKWGWWALSSQNISTARRQALQALRLRPWSRECWRLALCSLRGH